jgi:hypothetical protein
MKSVMQKISAVFLVLLYLGTTTGFAVVNCHERHKQQIVFLQTRGDCKCTEQKATEQKEDCCATATTHNENEQIFQSLQKAVEGECCSLTFKVLDTQTNVPSAVTDSKSDFSNDYFTLPCVSDDLFSVQKNYFKKIERLKPPSSEKIPLIYIFCKLLI